jgi:seryl-tRNA synthetase
MNDLLPEKAIPVKYVGFSTNFRKEAGTHGKDTKGIFRTHQFDKVEQIIICKPEDSWKFHEKMIKTTEKLYQALKLPYIIRSIAAGDLNDNAAKKYDLEAWFPAQNKYRELVSGSNCTDYQARKLNIRFVDKKGERNFVHVLNCTGIATERTICAILENYQQKDGSVKIPAVLQKYMNGLKKIKRKN